MNYIKLVLQNRITGTYLKKHYAMFNNPQQINKIHHHHHSCRSHATKTAFISSTTLRCLSIHLAVAPEISTSWYQYPFSLGFSWSCLCSEDVGGHVVVVRLVAASREPVSEGGQLASSKDVLSSGDSFWWGGLP